MRRNPSALAWGAVAAVARGELRRRWRALVMLGLLAGAAAGLVAGTAAVGARTGSAYARLLEATAPDDARLLVTEPELLPGVLAQPQVRSSWIGITVVGQRAGAGPLQYVGVSAGPPAPPGLFHPVVVRGRAAAGADEVVVSEQITRRLAGEIGLDLGDVLTLDLLTPTEIRSFATGFGAPDGPRVALRVVGVVRYPAWGEGLQNVLATPAFADRYAALSPGPTALVRLADGPGARAGFDAAVRAAVAGARLPRGDGGFAPIEAAYPPVPDPTVQASQAVLSGALGLLAAVAAVAGILLLLQGFARHHAVRAGDQRVEAALGLTRAERTLARTLPALLPAALAAVVAAAATVAAGLVDP
ncbi:MAG: ABC transporter permease, partial [Motilibacteraceae bacterium]